MSTRIRFRLVCHPNHRAIPTENLRRLGTGNGSPTKTITFSPFVASLRGKELFQVGRDFADGHDVADGQGGSPSAHDRACWPGFV